MARNNEKIFNRLFMTARYERPVQAAKDLHRPFVLLFVAANFSIEHGVFVHLAAPEDDCLVLERVHVDFSVFRGPEDLRPACGLHEGGGCCGELVSLNSEHID